MIKIDVDKIENIKLNHKRYIQEHVENKMKLYSIFTDKQNEISNFIINTLYKELYNITLEKLDFNYIKDINKKYKKIENKKIDDYVEDKIIKKVLYEIENYLKYIDTTNGNIEDIDRERRKKLEESFEKIKNITSQKIDLYKFEILNINFKVKKDIQQNIEVLKFFLEESIKGKDGYYDLKHIIKGIFNYKKFSNESIWGRHKVMYDMNIEVCPYCNRNYITNYIKNGKEKTTADLDHFFCQDKYPYLALSLYNFIPSCTTCNSRFKGKKDFLSNAHIFPHKEGFEKDAIFRTTLNKDSTLDYILGNSLDFDINISIETEDKEKQLRIKNSITTFNIEELYSNEKEFVKNIIKQVNLYNDHEIRQILDISNLFESEEELRKIIFGFTMEEKNLSKKPFSKLALDIFEEFNPNI